MTGTGYKAPPRVRPEIQQAVFALVKQVGRGEVASYGMIASLLPGVTARMVGHAMRHAGTDGTVPWHRIIGSSGMVSSHEGASRQQTLLTDEGVTFSKSGRVLWRLHRWPGPMPDWLAESDMDPIDVSETMARWP